MARSSASPVAPRGMQQPMGSGPMSNQKPGAKRAVAVGEDVDPLEIVPAHRFESRRGGSRRRVDSVMWMIKRLSGSRRARGVLGGMARTWVAVPDPIQEERPRLAKPMSQKGMATLRISPNKKKRLLGDAAHSLATEFSLGFFTLIELTPLLPSRCPASASRLTARCLPDSRPGLSPLGQGWRGGGR